MFSKSNAACHQLTKIKNFVVVCSAAKRPWQYLNCSAKKAVRFYGGSAKRGVCFYGDIAKKAIRFYGGSAKRGVCFYGDIAKRDACFNENKQCIQHTRHTLQYFR